MKAAPKRSSRPRVDRFLDKPTFKEMLDACDACGDKRTKSMLLVQFQSFAGLRELLIIGNSMGLKIGGELRKGANLVPLHFEFRRGGRNENWTSFIGTDASEALRDWFATRGWSSPNNPYIWPVRQNGKARELTARDVSSAYSRLVIGFGVRPRRSTGAGVRYGVSSAQVRKLAVACALSGAGADHMIVYALAGYKVNWQTSHLRRPDEKLLEQSYRSIEPHISI